MRGHSIYYYKIFENLYILNFFHTFKKHFENKFLRLFNNQVFYDFLDTMAIAETLRPSAFSKLLTFFQIFCDPDMKNLIERSQKKS